MKKDLKLIIDKMNNLFITERKKYIIQKDDGTYSWLEVKEGNNVKKFHDHMLVLHIERKYTYGIFSGSMLTKFISFDIDLISPEIVHGIYSELNRVGIKSHFIYTSWSGSKGYHVDVYFSKPIQLSYIKKLYDFVTYNLQKEFPNIDIKKKVELRPSPKHGLKLPLGINRKNKDSDSNVCWYVDVHNSFEPIKKIDYILNIEQVEEKTVKEIINKLPDIEDNNESISAIKNDKSNDFHFEISYVNNTIKALESLDKNGLIKKGTRNASLCKLAIYYKALGATKNQCKDRLINWMDNQEKKYYKTPLEICYKEIERIVHGVYGKNIPLRIGKTEIEISRNEILTLHYYDKIIRKTLFALFIHCKRYGDENGEFFMTYDQLSIAAKHSKTTAINHIKILEKEGLLKVFRSPIYFDNNQPRNLPNKYKLNLQVKLIDDERNKKVRKKVKVPSEYSSTVIQAIIELFPNLEWGRMNEIIEELRIEKSKIS